MLGGHLCEPAWIKEAVLKIKVEGISQLKIVNDNAPRSEMMIVLLPNGFENGDKTKTIIRRIRAQNEDLRTEEWKVHRKCFLSTRENGADSYSNFIKIHSKK